MKIRFTTTTQNGERGLFSATLKKNGDLILSSGNAAFLGFDGKDLPISAHKFSVHRSPASKTYNTITHTLSHRGGCERTTALTDAIKTKSGFAFVFARRWPDFSHEKYRLPAPKGEQRRVICGVDTNRENLLFGVFISHRDNQYIKTDLAPMRISQTILGEFNLVISTCVSPLPSHPTGEFLYKRTYDPSDPPAQLIGDPHKIMTGQTCVDCSSLFFVAARLLMTRFVALRYAEAPEGQIRDTLFHFGKALTGGRNLWREVDAALFK